MALRGPLFYMYRTCFGGAFCSFLKTAPVAGSRLLKLPGASRASGASRPAREAHPGTSGELAEASIC